MKRKILLCILIFAILIPLSMKGSKAEVTSCGVEVSPTSVNASGTSDLTFQVTNTDSVTYNWVNIVSPSTDFTIVGASSSWSGASSPTEATFSNSTLQAGNSVSFTVTVQTGSSETASQNWTVEASDDGGTNVFGCTGSLGVAIAGQAPDTSGPQMSDITLSTITSSAVTISWTTDEAATSHIEYGTTNEYGTTANSTSLATSHSYTLSSLAANTTYHFFVRNTDSESNSSDSSDSTFTTAAPGLTSETRTVTVTRTVTPTPTPTPIPDRTGPTVRIDTSFAKPYKEAPKITGRATDGKSVSRVEYTIDNGVNWQPVDNANLGKATSSFSFTPAFLDDDTYKLKVRAIDSSGNIGVSGLNLLTIDRLPPNVGGVVFSLGPQLVYPLKEGKIYGLQGMDQKITLSAVGGPTNIDIVSDNNLFSLTKNVDSGLWSGILSFETFGEFDLVAKSVDGGGSRTERNLGSIVILPRGKVFLDQDKSKDAVITVYYFDITTKRFVLWDGKAYGQINPQKIKSDGSYALYLPSGKYYMEIKANGYRNLRTDIFEISKSTPIISNFKLDKKIAFFDIVQSSANVDTSLSLLSGGQVKNFLIGTQFPEIELSDGVTSIESNSLRGKRMLISILNSWNPQVFQQISILNEIAKKGEIGVAAIFPQESASRINILKLRGSYGFQMLADRDGLTIDLLKILQLPINIYVSKNGTIESVKYEILNSEEIESNLLN